MWYYTQYSINSNLITYESFESLVDTFYEGHDSKKIEQISRGGMNNHEIISNIYMFKHNDSVFYYNNDLSRYCLLYDFSAKQKDTIKLDCFYAHYSTGLSSLLVLIDSVKTISINGQPKKVQYVKSGDGLVIEFGGINIEDIGNTSFMFPTYDNTYDGPLRCYTFNGFVYKNPFYNNQYDKWNGECNQITTGIKDIINGDIQILPNPVVNNLYITNIQGLYKYKLYNITGIELINGTIIQNQNIDVSYLSNDIYILVINNGIIRKHFKIIKN